MIGSVLDGNSGGGTVILRVFLENGGQELNDHRRAAWRHSSSNVDVHIRFEIRIDNSNSQSEGCSLSDVQISGRRYNNHRAEKHLSSSFYQKPVQTRSNFLFRGLPVLLANDDDVNRAVTRKLLETLGCIVSVVSSGFECLSAIGHASSPFQIVLLEL
ncbi:hypothetical protein DITRI_Ditri13aG0037700 [Diplodiscus trichospermus]